MAITSIPFAGVPILAVIATVALGQTLRHPSEPEWNGLRLGVGLASYAAAAGPACALDTSAVNDGLAHAFERYSLSKTQLDELNGVVGAAAISVIGDAPLGTEACNRVRYAGESALRLLRPHTRENARFSLTKRV